MKVIDLLNKIANGEIEDKTKFRIYFANNQNQLFKNKINNIIVYLDYLESKGE